MDDVKAVIPQAIDVIGTPLEAPAEAPKPEMGTPPEAPAEAPKPEMGTPPEAPKPEMKKVRRAAKKVARKVRPKNKVGKKAKKSAKKSPKKAPQEGESQEKEDKESEALTSNENLPTKARGFLLSISWKASPHFGEGDYLRAVHAP